MSSDYDKLLADAVDAHSKVIAPEQQKKEKATGDKRSEADRQDKR